MSVIVILLVGGLVAMLLNALLILVVGKIGVGMEVDGFGPAIITALLMFAFSFITYFVWDLLNFEPEAGWSGFATRLISSAGALLVAGGIVKGLRVKGFVGALLAVLGMAGVGWLANWLIGLIA